MKLQIVRVADRGVPNKERLHLRVLAESTLAFYVVLRGKRVAHNQVSSGSVSAYWFPALPAKAGDQVIVYSGFGKNSSKLQIDGSTIHFFYWGSESLLWSSENDCAVVVEGSNWETGF